LRLLGGRVRHSSLAGFHHPGSLRTRRAPTAPASTRSPGVYLRVPGASTPDGAQVAGSAEVVPRARASQAAQTGTRIPATTNRMMEPMRP